VLCVSLIIVSPFPRVSLHVNLRTLGTSGASWTINDSGSLSELDLSKNDLRSEGLSVVSEALKSTSIKLLNIAENNLVTLAAPRAPTEAEVVEIRARPIYRRFVGMLHAGLPEGPVRQKMASEGLVADAIAIFWGEAPSQLSVIAAKATDMSRVIKVIGDMKDMGSLSSLILKGNQLANREAGAALGSMLKTCTSLTALDVSGNAYDECDGPGFASEIASGLRDAKGSLVSLNLAENQLGPKGAKHIAEMLPKW
jgi:hypothetical protein